MPLKPCPSSPNCISTQADAGDQEHYTAPMPFQADPDAVLDAVQVVLAAAPGARITGRTGQTIGAVFTTKIFRFKDDVSFLVDPEAQLLHFRSASRVGKSDLGANRKRMDALIPLIQSELAK